MRILILTETLNPRRGYGRFSYDLISHFSKNISAAKILACRGEDRFEQERLVLLRNHLLGVFINPFIIAWYARGCDVIHALDGYPYGLYAALANIVLRKKLVITMQGTYAVEPLYHQWKGILLRWAYRNADQCTAISEYTKQQVLKKVPTLSVAVILHGAECKNFSYSNNTAMVSGDYIISVGTITHRKGYHVSLEAFAKLKKESAGGRNNLKYVIVGKSYSTEYQRELDTIIAREHLKEDVLFFHDISESELANLYHYAKVFVLHSLSANHHFEGFGLVFLEAGCFGLPVVGARGSGAEDAIRDGITGFLVSSESTEKTAEAIKKLLTDEHLRQTMGANNLQFARSRPWSTVAKEYQEIYKNIFS